MKDQSQPVTCVCNRVFVYRERRVRSDPRDRMASRGRWDYQEPLALQDPRERMEIR